MIRFLHASLHESLGMSPMGDKEVAFVATNLVSTIVDKTEQCTCDLCSQPDYQRETPKD